MRALFPLTVGFALVAAAPVVAQGTMTPSEAAAVELAIARGELMYAYDQAAWHGTDDMVARMKAADSYDTLAHTVGGWVVEGPAAAPVATFFSKDEAQPRAVYRAALTDGGRKVANAKLPGDGPESTITPAQLALIKALRSARAEAVKQKIGLCNDRAPNTIVLPPATADGPALVYFLTPQTASDIFPLGGHHRFDVDPAGKILSTRRFMNSCFPLNRAEMRGPNRAGQGFLMVAHLLDPTPTEIHVFSTLAANTQIGVITTNKRIWMVTALEGRARIVMAPITDKK